MGVISTGASTSRGAAVVAVAATVWVIFLAGVAVVAVVEAVVFFWAGMIYTLTIQVYLSYL
jgi:hypothetical protein